MTWHARIPQYANGPWLAEDYYPWADDSYPWLVDNADAVDWTARTPV